MIQWLANIFMAVCIALPSMAWAQDSQHPAAINLMFLAERMDISQFKDFAVAHGAKINPVFYTNAYLMMIRVRQGAYDSPIDVLSTQLHNQNALKSVHGLERLNHDMLPNLRQMDPLFLHLFAQDIDNKYTVPIWGGIMCLLVNKSLLDPGKITSYADLWRPDLQGKILIPEDMGNLMLLAFKVMDCEPQNTDKALLGKAWEKMCALAENSKLITNNALEFLSPGSNIAMALVDSPEALEALQQNPDLVMITPKEGYLGWIEAVSIPAHARNKELAHAYINYLLQPLVLANICQKTGYIPLNNQAYNMLKQHNSRVALFSPQELIKFTSHISTIPLDGEYQARWHNFVEDKQFLD